jgi:quinol monooxygenase YgiN
MSTITVVAKVVAKKECIEAVKSELIKMITPTRHEVGCIEYRLHQDNQDPEIFIFYENWESLSCLNHHLDSPHYKSYVAAVTNMIKDKTVHKMTEIA